MNLALQHKIGLGGATAVAAGHPDLPVPPTVLFSSELDVSDPFVLLTEFGVDLRLVLHGARVVHLPPAGTRR